MVYLPMNAWLKFIRQISIGKYTLVAFHELLIGSASGILMMAYEILPTKVMVTAHLVLLDVQGIGIHENTHKSSLFKYCFTRNPGNKQPKTNVFCNHST